MTVPAGRLPAAAPFFPPNKKTFSLDIPGGSMSSEADSSQPPEPKRAPGYFVEVYARNSYCAFGCDGGSDEKALASAERQWKRHQEKHPHEKPHVAVLACGSPSSPGRVVRQLYPPTVRADKGRIHDERRLGLARRMWWVPREDRERATAEWKEAYG